MVWWLFRARMSQMTCVLVHKHVRIDSEHRNNSDFGEGHANAINRPLHLNNPTSGLTAETTTYLL